MKLGVFGDSHATGDFYYRYCNGFSWPQIVADKLNCTHDVFALGGSPLFYSYQHFIQNYNKYSHIVFIYTDYMRINGMPDYLMQFSSRQENELSGLVHDAVYKEYKEELTTIIKSRRYTDNEDFNKFVYQAIFDKVNSICEKNDIKLVNIHPFEEARRTVLDFSSRKASCLLNLFVVSCNELGKDPFNSTHRSLNHPSFKDLVVGIDIRPNHLNAHNNKELADIIYTSFYNIVDPIDLTKHDGFCYDAEIVLDMIQAYHNEN